MKKKEIADYLDMVGLQYMATIGLDGKPKVRPVHCMAFYDDKLWFCTNSEKSMYKELIQNPFVDICASRLMENEIDTAWIRMSANVVFEENTEVKQMIMKKNSIVHVLYKNDPNHPLFKVFYLMDVKGVVNNLGHVKGLKEKPNFPKPVEFEF